LLVIAHFRTEETGEEKVFMQRKWLKIANANRNKRYFAVSYQVMI
jgi:hypothetical protein